MRVQAMELGSKSRLGEVRRQQGRMDPKLRLVPLMGLMDLTGTPAEVGIAVLTAGLGRCPIRIAVVEKTSAKG